MPPCSVETKVNAVILILTDLLKMNFIFRIEKLLPAYPRRCVLVVYCGIALIFCGCASAPKNDWSGKTTERSSQIVNSIGGNSAKNRMEKSRMLQTLERVTWGGVAAIEQGGKNLAPVASANLTAIQDELVKRLTQKSVFSNLEIVGLPGRAETEVTSLQMHVVLQHESTTSTVIGDLKKTSYHLFGQIVFFDTRAAMQVTAAYPISLITAELGEVTAEKLANFCIFNQKKARDGKPLGFIEQIIFLLENEAIIPRAVLPPVAVLPVDLQPLNGKLNISVYNKSLLDHSVLEIPSNNVLTWPDQMGRNLSALLGANTGLPINPYVGNNTNDQFSSLSVLSQAAALTMRTAENQQILGKISPPRYFLELQLQRITREESSDVQKRRTFQTALNYGAEICISLKNADSGKLSEQVVLKLAGEGRNLGRLAARYRAISEFNVLKNKISDPQELFMNFSIYMDELLLQLAREIAFPEEDILKRFEKFRALMKRNA